MVFIEDVLISEDVFTETFFCHLEKCKGACCWEGDYGAPLLEDEKIILDKINNHIFSYIPEKSVHFLSENPGYVYEKKQKIWATYCHEDGACVYVHFDSKSGIAHCGIETAHRDNKINFIKPLSCHLYPIRVSKNEVLGFEAWNYDRWDICGVACMLGAEKKTPVFQFLKSAIIRAKGEDFYAQMEEAYQHFRIEKKEDQD